VTPLTNFIVKPVEMVESDEETQLTADLVTVRDETFRHSFLTTISRTCSASNPR
jgi:hypothetical protein